MKTKNVLVIALTFIVLVTVSFGVVSAQDIDVDNMDNEQLTALLMQILNKLQQEDSSAPETDPEAAETPAPAQVPAADPEAIEEVIQITIYDNKKLSIEALPAYMFIQPTKPVKPERDQGTQSDKGSEHYPGEICAPDLACDVVDGILVNCHPYRTWEFIDGEWMCPVG